MWMVYLEMKGKNTRKGERGLYLPGGTPRMVGWGCAACPYFWPNQKLDDTLYLTIVADTVALDIIYEGFLFLVLSGDDDKKVGSNINVPYARLTPTIPNLWPNWPISIPCLWPKRLKNQSFRAARTYISHTKERSREAKSNRNICRVTLMYNFETESGVRLVHSLETQS